MSEQNLVSNSLTLTGHAGAVYSIDCDGKYIYSASADKYVVRWNLETGKQDAFAIKFNSSPYSIKLFNNNTFIAVGLANGDLHIFDLVDRKEVKFYQQHTTGIFNCSENKFTNHLYVGDAAGNLSVWNTQTLELAIYLPFDAGKIRSIIPSLDGKILVIASQDGFIRILDAVTFNEINSFYAHVDGATSILDLGNNIILTGGKDAHLNQWNTLTSEKLASLPAHNYVIYDLLRLNDSIFVTASRDKSMKIWDVDSLKVIQRIERKDGGHKHSVNRLVKISDKSFASCSDDTTIKVWELQ